jgi:hypothetical protein
MVKLKPLENDRSLVLTTDVGNRAILGCVKTIRAAGQLPTTIKDDPFCEDVEPTIQIQH